MIKNPEEINLSLFREIKEEEIPIIFRMKNDGCTIDQIARKFQVTETEINRTLHPPKNYGNYTKEEKLKHKIAGYRRAMTLKRQREEKKKQDLKLKTWR